MGTLKRKLTSEESAHWYDLLEKRRQVVLASEDTLKRHVLNRPPDDEYSEITKSPFHSSDLIADAQEMEMLEALSERNMKTLNEIEDAKKRLDKGVYGLCENCNDPILLERLEAIPETRYCLECEQDIETYEKRAKPKKQIKSVSQMPSVSDILGRMQVSEIMQSDPITVSSGEGLDSAASLLSEHNIRHLPVIDDEGDLQGVISDRDLLGVLLRVKPWRIQDRYDNSWDRKTVDNVMTKTPETVNPDTSLLEAGAMLLDFKISCLPVVEGNRLVGILTESDFVKLVSTGNQ